jgi:hypothetical protein
MKEKCICCGKSYISQGAAIDFAKKQIESIVNNNTLKSHNLQKNNVRTI